MEYIAAIARNQVARSVKIVDLTHNMDVTRLDSMDEKTEQRLLKYQKALGQYRTIRQERMVRKFGSAKRHFFAGILDVFQEKVTHSRDKVSTSRRRRHCAVLP